MSDFRSSSSFSSPDDHFILSDEVKEELEAVLSVYDTNVRFTSRYDGSILDVKYSQPAVLTTISLPNGYPKDDPAVEISLTLSSVRTRGIRAEVDAEVKNVIAENASSCRLFMIIECLRKFDEVEEGVPFDHNDAIEEEGGGGGGVEELVSALRGTASTCTASSIVEDDCSVEVIHGEPYTERKR